MFKMWLHLSRKLAFYCLPNSNPSSKSHVGVWKYGFKSAGSAAIHSESPVELLVGAQVFK